MNDGPLSARLDALASYDILDTPAEPGFDDLVAIAAHICGTPVSLVSLVERDRQWFKARLGFDPCETPIGQSVCDHGMTSNEMLVIPDLTRDPRTRANLLVTEAPHIRFYAGAPLVTPAGVTIGMLCVIDTVARPDGLTEAQARALEALARQVMTQLELRRAMRLLADSNARSQLAEEAGGIGTFELNVATNLMTVSAEFCRLFGLPVAEHYPATLLEEIVDRADSETRSNVQSRADGSAVQSVEYRVPSETGGPPRWLRRRASFARDADGAVTHMFGTVQDITAQRMLNDEIGHRLKNSLTLVQAIAGHSLREVSERQAVTEFEQRIQALAAAHDLLLQRNRAGGALEAIVETVLDNLGLRDRTVTAGPNVDLNAQATLNVAMLLHELATNALKYGAFLKPEGRVHASWRIEGKDLAFDWVERGGPPASQPTRKGFGSRLIERGLAGSGDVALTYGEAGFTALLRTPLDRIEA